MAKRYILQQVRIAEVPIEYDSASFNPLRFTRVFFFLRFVRGQKFCITALSIGKSNIRRYIAKVCYRHIIIISISLLRIKQHNRLKQT